MKITQTHIKNLLQLLSKGLVHGAGESVNRFCVQQAVHRVIDDALDDASKTDSPPSWCISDAIRQFGIHLNDEDGWNTNQDRAEGLKRFAIAELGSDKIEAREFFEKLADKLSAMVGLEAGFFSYSPELITEFRTHDHRGITTTQQLTRLANAAAEVLKELGTEGSQFLYLVDEPDKEKRDNEARRLGHQIFAVQLAEDKHRWGADSDFGLPVKSHHHHHFKK